MFRPADNFNTQTGSSYHTISVFYGTDFSDNNLIKIRDLEVFKPVCYLNNNRIRKCTIDTVNNKITMSFQFALTANNEYHILFGQIDPRKANILGFLAKKSIANIRVYYVLARTSTVKYTETQKFPSYFSLPTGASQGPFRGIIKG